MKLAVPMEVRAGERRVAVVPAEVARLASAGMDVVVQSGAGLAATFGDQDYRDAGAEVATSVEELYRGADVVAKVQPPSSEEVDALPEGVVLISFLSPTLELDTVRRLAARRIRAFSFDLVPRISRAQSMDALSSQATVAGYRAVLLAATRLGRLFPLLMTAAGTVAPAKVLVMGAGVAGLQAIATARRLGAQVSAYDVRAAARDEVRSLGASFLELELETAEGSGGYAAAQSEEFLARQQEMIGNHVASSDVVITTAAIPGRRAPLLVTAGMVERMRRGSVIVDLASATGGNCELTRPGEEVDAEGVLVIAADELAAGAPTHASSLYARNVSTLLGLLVRGGNLDPDWTDEIIDKAAVTADGQVRHVPTRELLEARS